jgi:outer membrane protein
MLFLWGDFIMKKTVLALALLAASAGAFAQSFDTTDGNWLVRMRALRMDSANKDSTGQDLSVNNKWIIAGDVSYFFTPNLAVELLLGLPQKLNVYSSGRQIGTLRGLPPTVTLQYHFTGLGQFKPYLGVGLNYTHFSSVNLMGGAADVKRDSVGPALQVGTDFAVTKHVYLNLDIKKVWIKTEVSAGGRDLGSFKIDPWIIGVGIGYRF